MKTESTLIVVFWLAAASGVPQRGHRLPSKMQRQKTDDKVALPFVFDPAVHSSVRHFSHKETPMLRLFSDLGKFTKGAHKRRKKRFAFSASAGLLLPLSYFQRFFPSHCPDSEKPCPTWTSFAGGDTCSATCGGGIRQERRYCKHQRTGKPCLGSSTRSEPCNTHACPSWATWTMVSSCNYLCGSGQQLYARRCVNSNRVTVRGCLGKRTEVRACPAIASCVPNWSEWTDYSECSRSCGGTQTRRRHCVRIAGSIATCRGMSMDMRKCSTTDQCFPTHTAWSAWLTVDLPCGVWTVISRSRSCLVETCPQDSLTQKRLISGEKCKASDRVVSTSKVQNDALHSWTSWSTCSHTCGSLAFQKRSRKCQANFGHGPILCSEEHTETRRCKGQMISCPMWSSWSACEGNICPSDKRCIRSRFCVTRRKIEGKHAGQQSGFVRDAENRNGSDISVTSENVDSELFAISSGNESTRENILTRFPRISTVTSSTHVNHTMSAVLSGGNSDTREFFDTERFVEEIVDESACEDGVVSSKKVVPCDARDYRGEWGSWSRWTTCSVTCGTGFRMAARKCNRTQTAGACEGSRLRYSACYHPPCWSHWSTYTPCTTSCGPAGVKTRRRECVGKTTDILGYNQCRGNQSESVRCNTHLCPILSEWTEYGSCSATCGNGKRIKLRRCVQGLCEGEFVLEEDCKVQECAVWSHWSGYSCCSTSCGPGYKLRIRQCNNKIERINECPGADQEAAACNPGDCKDARSPSTKFECGVKPTRATKKKIFIRIIGGVTAERHAWPWQVSIQNHQWFSWREKRWQHICGGTLIHPLWVVSAAHCTVERDLFIDHEDTGRDWSVLAGSSNVSSNVKGQRFGIKRIFVHPNYANVDSVRSDIELIKLRSEVSISSSMMPACFPQQESPHPGEKCFVTGWGYAGGNSTEILREASIPIYDFERCTKLGSKYRQHLNSREHMCAGDPKKSTDTCQGDSGGPLVCVREDGRWYLAGVTSFGFSTQCGIRNHVGVYVPVTKYEAWIRNTILNSSHAGC